MKGYPINIQIEEKIINFYKGLNLNIRIEYPIFESHSFKGEQTYIKIVKIEDNQLVSTFSLIGLPGCCGIVVSTGAWVNFKYQKLGIGQFLHKIRIEIAKDWGYSLLLCTDVDTNSNQKHILEKNNWKLIEQFTNSRTNNLINIHILKL